MNISKITRRSQGELASKWIQILKKYSTLRIDVQDRILVDGNTITLEHTEGKVSNYIIKHSNGYTAIDIKHKKKSLKKTFKIAGKTYVRTGKNKRAIKQVTFSTDITEISQDNIQELNREVTKILRNKIVQEFKR
jgi:hypothetical protein